MQSKHDVQHTGKASVRQSNRHAISFASRRAKQRQLSAALYAQTLNRPVSRFAAYFSVHLSTPSFVPAKASKNGQNETCRTAHHRVSAQALILTRTNWHQRRKPRGLALPSSSGPLLSPTMRSSDLHRPCSFFLHQLANAGRSRVNEKAKPELEC